MLQIIPFGAFAMDRQPTGEAARTAAPRAFSATSSITQRDASWHRNPLTVD
jgi:hypothetical protein